MKESMRKANKTSASDWLRSRSDFLLFLLPVSGFVFVAAQRLGTVPVPEGDEAMILQLPYEVLYRGKFAWPMFRLLGGNVENAWHSLRPLYFWIVTGIAKLFGF